LATDADRRVIGAERRPSRDDQANFLIGAALSYNVGNFRRTLATPGPIKDCGAPNSRCRRRDEREKAVGIMTT
jgi:hypothetical protein